MDTEAALLENDNGTLRSKLPANLEGKVAHPARVRLGQGARFELRDVDTSAAIAVTLAGTKNHQGTLHGHRLTYPNALGNGVHLVQSVGARGVEDFVVTESGSGPTSLSYTVELVQGVAGLRLVDDVLEFVDEGGAPRLRMAKPWVADAQGKRADARTAVEGCQVDRSPAGPWGRAPVRPGSAACEVKVSWETAGLSGPAVVIDPVWMTTGAMVWPRWYHGAVLLDSGKVLVAGGMTDVWGENATVSSELFDPASAIWASTMPKSFTTHSPRMLRLLSGKVLETESSNGAHAEVYDPTTGAWTPTAAPSVNHSGGGLAVLKTGRVLGNGELYDPSTKTWIAVAESDGQYFASLLDGRVISCGGPTGCKVYDDEALTWTPTGPFPGGASTNCLYSMPSGSVVTCPSYAITYVPSTNSWLDSTENCSLGSPEATTALGDGSILSARTDMFDPYIERYPGGLYSLQPNLHRGFGLSLTALQGGGSVLLTGGRYQEQTPNTQPPQYVEKMQPQSEVLVLDQKSTGQPCAFNAECVSGVCVDGVCCSTICNGLCEACSAVKKGAGSDGTCGPVDTNRDPDNDCSDEGQTSCGRNGQCDGAGKCAWYPVGAVCGVVQCLGNSVLGNSCTGPLTCESQTVDCAPYKCTLGACPHSCSTDNDCVTGHRCGEGLCIPKSTSGTVCSAATECASTFCVDGVCCDSLCGNQCEACGETDHKGTCVAVVGSRRAGRPVCTGTAGECGGTCEGGKRDGCGYPDATKLCGNTRCEGQIFKPETCDGLGACVPAATKDCGDYACDPAAKKCKVRCSVTADCASGRVCNDVAEQCAPISHECKDDFTAIGADGAEVQCAPYKCAAGVCRDVCSTTQDCVSGFACDTGRCRLAPTDGGTDPQADSGTGAPAATQIVTEKGCGCKTPGGSSGSNKAFAMIALALGAARLRRRVSASRRLP